MALFLAFSVIMSWTGIMLFFVSDLNDKRLYLRILEGVAGLADIHTCREVLGYTAETPKLLLLFMFFSVFN